MFQSFRSGGCAPIDMALVVIVHGSGRITIGYVQIGATKTDCLSDSVVEPTYATFVLHIYLRLRLRKLVENIILLQPNLNGWPNI